MKRWRRGAAAAFLIGAGLVLDAGAFAAQPAATDAVTLLADLHFADPAGGDVVVPAGEYRVTADGEALRLAPVGRGEALVLAAVRKTHEENLDAPVVIVDSGDAQDIQDLLYLALLLPDGGLLEATGSTTGVVGRGLRDRFKNRPRPIRNLVAATQQAIQSAVATGADFEAKGFESETGGSDPDAYTLLTTDRDTDAPYRHDIPSVPDSVELDAQSDVRTTVSANVLRYYDCESEFTGRRKTGLQLFGQCRLYVEDGTSRVKLRDVVETIRGSASQTFEWISTEFCRPSGGTVDMTLTIGVTGKLQSFGINSAAGLELSAFLESRARDSDEDWVVDATDKWSARAEAASQGVGIDAGPVSFGVSGYISAPLFVDEDVLFLMNDLELKPQYVYRVRVKAKAEATTGLKPLAAITAPGSGAMFPTQANFERYVRGSTRKDYGMAWKSLVITTD